MLIKLLIIAVIILAVIVIALLFKLIFIKKFNYMPNIGEVYKNKICISLDDSVYENHRTKTPVGTVKDYFNISLCKPTVHILVPYEAISKNGRFLIIASSNQTYWVEPNTKKSKYVLKIEEIENSPNKN